MFEPKISDEEENTLDDWDDVVGEDVSVAKGTEDDAEMLLDRTEAEKDIGIRELVGPSDVVSVNVGTSIVLVGKDAPPYVQSGPSGIEGP